MGQGVERQVETYRDTEISTLVLPGRESRPAYALVCDYLLIARDKATLQKCIDAKATGQNLATDERFAAILKNMPPKHTALFYADLEAIAVALLKARRPQAGTAPPGPLLTLAGELRRVYGALSADESGLLLETYSRPGLAGVLAAVSGWLAPAAAPTPPALERTPRRTDF